MDDVLTLLKTTYTENNAGIPIPTNTRKDVLCQKHSVSRSEFFNAGRNGFNPAYVFTIFKGEYEGESICEYNGLTYAIYRTYETDDDYMELYVERKGGTNGEKSDTGNTGG